VGFQEFKILTADTVHRVNRCHCTKFHANQSNHCGDMDIFDWSSWRLQKYGLGCHLGWMDGKV